MYLYLLSQIFFLIFVIRITQFKCAYAISFKMYFLCSILFEFFFPVDFAFGFFWTFKNMIRYVILYRKVFCCLPPLRDQTAITLLISADFPSTTCTVSFVNSLWRPVSVHPSSEWSSCWRELLSDWCDFHPQVTLHNFQASKGCHRDRFYYLPSPHSLPVPCSLVIAVRALDPTENTDLWTHYREWSHGPQIFHMDVFLLLSSPTLHSNHKLELRSKRQEGEGPSWGARDGKRWKFEPEY